MIFRGAKRKINEMIGGSFYTNSSELAQEYAELENGKVYSYDIDFDLYDVTELLSCTDIDLGIENIFEELKDNDINIDELISNYDGVSFMGDSQIVLFGTLDNQLNFKKQTLNKLMVDVNLKTRRYDR